MQAPSSPVRRRAVLMRLDAFFRELRANPSLRRRLRSGAHDAFAEHGFCADEIPSTLPAPRTLDTLITHGQLYGLVDATPLAEPALELRLLTYGLKPLVLIHGQEAELGAAIAWGESRGFTALLSADEWDRQMDEGKGGYSNLATNMRRARAGSGAWRSLLVGADEDRTVLGWIALTLGWDAMLGRLLGYPPCCATAFARRWKDAIESHQGDVVAACIDESNSGPHDWRVNNLGRYFGAELIQHFPCCFGCAASRAAAQRTEAVLAAWEPELHAWTRGILRAPAIYTQSSGVAVLRDGYVDEGDSGLRVRYDPRRVLVTEPDGALDAALRSAATVSTLPGGRELTVGEHTLVARLVRFAELPAD